MRHRAHGRDGVPDEAVVGQSHMETVDAGLLEPFAKDLAFLEGGAALAKWRILANHDQLVLKGLLGQSLPDHTHQLQGEARPVFQASAVVVRSFVQYGRREHAGNPVPVDLDDVVAALIRPVSSTKVAFLYGADFLGGNVVAVGQKLFVHPFFDCGDAFFFIKRIQLVRIVFPVVDLGGNFSARGVNGVHKHLVAGDEGIVIEMRIHAVVL